LRTIVSGRSDAVTEKMKTYGREKVEKVQKFFGRATTAHVTLDIDAHDHATAEMRMEVANGVTLVGKAQADSIFAACDMAEQKLAVQVKKFKERLTDHHRGERRPQVDPTAPAPRAAGEREQTYEEVVKEMRGGE